MKIYTDSQLLDKVKSLPDYKGIPQGHWILGVRSIEDTADAFDDKFYHFIGESFRQVIKGTTNPGVKVLKNFKNYNPDGAAIVKADEWYYDLWKFGKHHGKIDALLQLGSKIKVYRDIDKDSKSEEEGKLQEGFFGINYHLNNYNIDAKTTGTIVADWSAGCQVCNDAPRYKKQMQEFKLSKQPTFTYCLIKEF
jgi:hypothetical protein